MAVGSLGGGTGGGFQSTLPLPGRTHLGVVDSMTKSRKITEVAKGAVDDIQALLHPGRATIRLSLPDRVGRLRRAAGLGDNADLGRKRSQRRRAALEDKRPMRSPFGAPPTQIWALLPLVYRNEAVGVVEVLAPESVINERWNDLARAVNRAARLIHRANEAGGDGDGLGDFRAVALVREMIRASSPRVALRAALDYSYQRFDMPVAGWLAAPGRQQLGLIGVRGLGSRKGRGVRRHMASLPRWESLTPVEREEFVRKFAELVDVEDVAVLPAGDALMIAGDARYSARRTFLVLGPLLEDVFDHLAIVTWAERRNAYLDLGIALTAHEIRGPISGARAAIDRLLTSEDGPVADRALLSRSRHELDELSGLVHSLLRWAVGVGRLQRRPVDMVRIAQDAAQSCQLETGEDRVSIVAPGPAFVSADAKHLRAAIANLVRNALVYAPLASEVSVTVEEAEEFVTLSVRDRGPGLAAEEREVIFDPFVRGAASGDSRSGSGLGLFVVRRIVEAHEGRIWVDSSRSGTTFHVQLPRRKVAWTSEASAS